MANGSIPYQRKLYSNISASSQVAKPEIELVSPTQSVVQQAKHDLKRKLKDMNVYKSKSMKTSNQLGLGAKRKSIKKKSKKKSTKTTKKKVSKKKSSSVKTKKNSKSKLKSRNRKKKTKSTRKK